MLLQDLRFAVRALVKRPGFTAVAVVTLALGIGANAAIFTVFNAVLLRPLPYSHVERIARIRGLRTTTRQPGNLSPMDFLDLRSRTRRFDRLAAFNNYADATLTGSGEPERIAGTRVTADFFSVLHVTPSAGRDFRSEDDVPGATPVTLLAHGFWLRRFAADPSIVGRTIRLNSVVTEVIGVLPASFRHPFPEAAREPDVFVPFTLDPKENNRGGHYLQAIGLLKPDASLADGESDLATITRDLERAYPATNTGETVTLEPLGESIVGAARSPLYILLGTVVFVLLIACVNLANLLLARSTSRQKEIAVRRALGADRFQIVRQLLVESVVVSLAGGASGLLLATWAVRVLVTLGADRIPRGATIAIDANVLLFALLLSIATGVAFGAGPALAAARGETQHALKDGGRSGDARIHQRAQQVLIASEIALALMLLIGAGLLVKSLWHLESVDPGFRADQVLTLRTSLPLARYPEGDEIPFYQRVEERLASMPGVRHVGAINILPLSGNYSCDGFDVDGRPPAAPGQQPCAESRSVTPGYFDAMGIPLLRGRAFARHDVEGAPPVVIISDEMARQFWPDRNPVGARILHQRSLRTIVGVVAGVKHFGLDRDAPFEMYTPHAQQPSYHTMTLVIRGSGFGVAGSGFGVAGSGFGVAGSGFSGVLAMVQRELWAIDRDVPIANVKTMEQTVADSTVEPRFRTLLLGAFAVLAVTLAIVGVGGVIAFSVSRRTQEIGIRVALGATRRQVTAMVVAHGLAPAAIGAAIGLAAASGVTRVLSGLLFGVTPLDASVYAAATLVLLLASAAASYLPARRAATIDPMLALRNE
jgi:putative ABC transport system permease protein